MINILYTISAIRDTGPNRVLENILKRLDRNKFKVYLLSYLDNDNEELIKKIENMGIYVICLNLKKKLDIVTIGTKLLNDVIIKYRIKFVHSNGILPDISNAKSNANIKFTTIHDNMFEDYILTFGRIKGRIIIKWHMHYLNMMNKCFCCSKTSYDILKKYLSNTKYIRNGIDIEKVNPKIRNDIRDQYGILESDVVYLYAGKISKLKRVKELIELFNNSLGDDEYLFIIGEKSKILESRSTNKHIIFLDFKKNILEYFLAADVYASFSSSEGFSISIIEALANNLLILVSDIDSHKECFDIDNNIYIGEYFNENNFNEKKDKIKEYLGSGLPVITEKFQNRYLSGKIMTNKYENEYEKLKNRRNVL